VNEGQAGTGIRVASVRGNGDAAFLRAVGRLRFVAAPTFAVMALLTAVLGGGPMDMSCSDVHVASPLCGMPLMYGLMSVFHVAPWLNRVGRRRHVTRRP